VRLLARGQIEFGDKGREEQSHADDALAMLGLTVDGSAEPDEEEFWLWPESEEAFDLWLSIQTQWSVGMGGATGLNYPGVEACMRLRGLKKKSRQKLFLPIQMMERVCLEEWARQRSN